MSHKKIPDFTETELWVVRSTLKERYGQEIEIQFAETETAATEGGGMDWYPTLFWDAKGAKFAIIKLGAKRYRPVFYYHPDTQLGTGIDSYDEIGDAVISVLQVEADHIRKQKIKLDEAAAGDESPAPDKPDLSPLFWGD
jgi:hypothetical protein